RAAARPEEGLRAERQGGLRPRRRDRLPELGDEAEHRHRRLRSLERQGVLVRGHRDQDQAVRGGRRLPRRPDLRERRQAGQGPPRRPRPRRQDPLAGRLHADPDRPDQEREADDLQGDHPAGRPREGRLAEPCWIRGRARALPRRSTRQMTEDATTQVAPTGRRRPSIGIAPGIGLLLVGVVLAWLMVNLVKTPSGFFSIFLDGLTLCLVFGLVALWYWLVCWFLELINFAHGDIFLLG